MITSTKVVAMIAVTIVVTILAYVYFNPTETETITFITNNSYGCNINISVDVQNITTPIEKTEFMKIAEEISSEHEWVANYYDCTEFSQDLVARLQKNGWEAYIKTGYWYYNGGTSCDKEDEELFNCRHEWVILEVPIESTSGEIINPDDYEKYYSASKR
jgi:hypothetical protein